MRKTLLLFYVCMGFLCLNTVRAQSVKELEAQKEKTKKEIAYTNQLLKETSKNAKTSLYQLTIINEEIRLRDKLIREITSQITVLNEQIEDNTFVVSELTDDLEKINKSYAKMIQHARRNQNDNDQLYFILSSKDFNQAYERFIYLRQLTEYRRKQSEAIASVRSVLDKKIIQLTEQRRRQEILLEGKIAESKKLSLQKGKQNKYYSNLQRKQKDLKKKLSNQRRIADKLDREIERVIAEEAKKVSANKVTAEVVAADQKLSANFADNKGELPWPVANGVITDRFGEHDHPVMKHVKIKNSGIDISTKEAEKARAVFAGEVSRVISIPGANMAVIVRHGAYLTVYSNLSKVYVRPGDKVKIKQSLGTVFTDEKENNTTTLKFQLWKESTKLNPELWILRK